MYEDRGDAMMMLLVVVVSLLLILFVSWYASNTHVVETYEFHAAVTELDTSLKYIGKMWRRYYYVEWQNGYESGRDRISREDYHRLKKGDLIHVYATVQETPTGIRTIYEIEP